MGARQTQSTIVRCAPLPPGHANCVRAELPGTCGEPACFGHRRHGAPNRGHRMRGDSVRAGRAEHVRAAAAAGEARHAAELAQSADDRSRRACPSRARPRVASRRASSNWRLNLYSSNAAGPGAPDARSTRVRLPMLAKTTPIRAPQSVTAARATSRTCAKPACGRHRRHGASGCWTEGLFGQNRLPQTDFSLMWIASGRRRIRSEPADK